MASPHHPIAGTFFKRPWRRRTRRHNLPTPSEDPKENAEHVMLVDLARNDLSRNCNNVTDRRKIARSTISHVVYMVSKVTGQLKPEFHTMQTVANTFPAGTLSERSKYKAMQLIEEIEQTNYDFTK
jgi:anthranilate synthase component 1